MWYNLIHLKFMLIENKFVVQYIIWRTSLKFVGAGSVQRKSMLICSIYYMADKFEVCRSRIGPKKIHVDHGAKLDAWSK